MGVGIALVMAVAGAVFWEEFFESHQHVVDNIGIGVFVYCNAAGCVLAEDYAVAFGYAGFGDYGGDAITYVYHIAAF